VSGRCRGMSRGLRLHLVWGWCREWDVGYEGTSQMEGLSLILGMDMGVLGEDAVHGEEGHMLVCEG
jgi:hypothetical protein